MVFDTEKIKDIEKKICVFFNSFPQQHRCEKIIFSPCFKSLLSEKRVCNLFSHKYKVLSLNDTINFSAAKSQPGFLQRTIMNSICTLLGLIPSIGSIISVSILLTGIVKDCVGELRTSEIEKYLNNNWKKNKHYKKVKYIIYVDDSSNLSKREIACLQILSFLISNKYLVNTAVLIAQPADLKLPYLYNCTETYDINVENILSNSVDKKSNYARNSLTILNIVGVENVEKLNYALSQKSSTNKTIETIVNAIWDEKGIKPCQELESFLNTCSLLFEQFELKDVEYVSKIQNYKNYGELFDIARNAEIIQGLNFQIFFFLQPFLREYYQNKNFTYPSDFYNKVYKYLEKKYPNQYEDLAIAIEILSTNNDEILSKNILAYYFCSYTISSYKLNKIIDNLRNFKLGEQLLKIDELYKNHEDNTELQIKCENFFDLLDRTNISHDAKLAALSYGARLYYELDICQDKLICISQKYRKIFAEIKLFSCHMTKHLNFALDFIAFSTCIENDYPTKEVVQKIVPLLQKTDVQELQREKYLRYLRLGNVIYNDSPNKSENLLEKGYILSKENFYLNSLASINYSVVLITQGQYSKANDILEDIVANHIKNSIVYLSAYNNFLISKYLLKTFSAEKIIKSFSSINVDNFQSDSCIIKNNLVSFQIMSGKSDFQNEINICNKIIKLNDIYHNFFAKHNIIVIYFLIKDERFWKIVDDIQTPSLMLYYKEIFVEKVNFLKENFHKQWNILQLTDALNKHLMGIKFNAEKISSFNYLPVLFGLIERWFE